MRCKLRQTTSSAVRGSNGTMGRAFARQLRDAATIERGAATIDRLQRALDAANEQIDKKRKSEEEADEAAKKVKRASATDISSCTCGTRIACQGGRCKCFKNGRACGDQCTCQGCANDKLGGHMA
ncbi:hypothetical protein T484DRAFT_2856179 [Baffinella frigidus]|nr:hypothetical protein T484DRAFT_2856179 [Cryptophyta sp. CCMP2293]